MTTQAKPTARRLDTSHLSPQPPRAAAGALQEKKPAPDLVLDEAAFLGEPLPAAAAAAPSPPSPPPPRDPNVVVFGQTYMAHGEPVKQIRLRKPVTREIRKHGNPLKLAQDANGMAVVSDLDWDRVARYVVDLSDPPLPPSTVDQLDYFDLDACAGVITGFFVRFAPEASTPS